MAKLGELESIVDNLVNRGLVSPKMVGRSVGQAAIETLSSLPSAIAQSRSVQQQQQAGRTSNFNRQIINNRAGVDRQVQASLAQRLADLTKQSQFLVKDQKKTQSKSMGSGLKNIKDITKPFVVGTTESGRVNIALPGSEGFSMRGLLKGTSDDSLIDLALKNTHALSIPKVNVEFWGGTYKTLEDLRNSMLGNGNARQISDFFS